jgi:hypothetical protein
VGCYLGIGKDSVLIAGLPEPLQPRPERVFRRAAAALVVLLLILAAVAVIVGADLDGILL